MYHNNYLKRSKTRPHSMHNSEENASTETYIFIYDIRKVFCQKVFGIQANLKERMQLQHSPLTKATGLLVGIYLRNPQFTSTLLHLESIRAFSHISRNGGCKKLLSFTVDTDCIKILLGIDYREKKLRKRGGCGFHKM